MSSLRESQRAALTELYAKLAGGAGRSFRLITAGPAPALQSSGDFMAALRIALSPAAGRGRFDLAIRLAATTLLPSAIGTLSSISVRAPSTSPHSRIQLYRSFAALMRNNSIRFFA